MPPMKLRCEVHPDPADTGTFIGVCPSLNLVVRDRSRTGADLLLRSEIRRWLRSRGLLTTIRG